jgi:hypothetical protein
MHISSSAAGGGGAGLHILRDLMRMGGVGSTGQQVPSDGQTVGNSDPPADPPPGPPPAGSTLATATLSSLLDAQQAKPSVTDLVGKLISDADSDGDGSLSLSEITSALSGKQNGGTSRMSAAFDSLDADGDGKLSSSELQEGLQTLFKAHHNHGRGHAYAYGRYGAQQAANTEGATTPSAATPSSETPAATETAPVDASV